jgi:hypothetical protein
MGRKKATTTRYDVADEGPLPIKCEHRDCGAENSFRGLNDKREYIRCVSCGMLIILSAEAKMGAVVGEDRKFGPLS